MTADELAMKIAVTMRGQEEGLLGGAIVLEDAREGYAKLSLKLGGDMLNGHGTAHGGVIFTLADTAFAYACNSRNAAAVASQASIVFLTPGQEGDILTAEAVEQAAEGRSGLYIVTVRGPENRVVAVFQGLSRSIGRKVLNDGLAYN
jgi:acyl-CoA thioesterase